MELVAFCIPTGLSVGILFGRNFYYTGDLKGGNSYHPDKPILNSARELYYSIVELIGVSHKIDGWNPTELVLIAACVVGLGLFWKYRRQIHWDRTQATAILNSRGLTLSLMYAVTTIVLLTYLELTTCVGLRARMFMPVVPFCLLVGGLVPHLVSAQGDANGRFRVIAVLLAAVFLLGQVKAAPRVFTSRPNYPALRASCAQNRGRFYNTVRSFCRHKYRFEHPVLANEPQVLGPLLNGQSSAWLRLSTLRTTGLPTRC